MNKTREALIKNQFQKWVKTSNVIYWPDFEIIIYKVFIAYIAVICKGLDILRTTGSMYNKIR